MSNILAHEYKVLEKVTMEGECSQNVFQTWNSKSRESCE